MCECACEGVYVNVCVYMCVYVYSCSQNPVLNGSLCHFPLYSLKTGFSPNLKLSVSIKVADQQPLGIYLSLPLTPVPSYRHN